LSLCHSFAAYDYFRITLLRNDRDTVLVSDHIVARRDLDSAALDWHVSPVDTIVSTRRTRRRTASKGGEGKPLQITQVPDRPVHNKTCQVSSFGKSRERRPKDRKRLVIVKGGDYHRARGRRFQQLDQLNFSRGSPYSAAALFVSPWL